MSRPFSLGTLVLQFSFGPPFLNEFLRTFTPFGEAAYGGSGLDRQLFSSGLCFDKSPSRVPIH